MVKRKRKKFKQTARGRAQDRRLHAGKPGRRKVLHGRRKGKVYSEKRINRSDR